jgi:hypothetical protein
MPSVKDSVLTAPHNACATVLAQADAVRKRGHARALPDSKANPVPTILTTVTVTKRSLVFMLEMSLTLLKLLCAIMVEFAPTLLIAIVAIAKVRVTKEPVAKLW